MFMTGVYRVSQLTVGKTRSWIGSPRKVSALLLNEIQSHENRDELYERIMLELVDDRGAYKRTSRSRFNSFDEKVVAEIRRRWGASGEPVSFLDTAVSSGQTAVDFFKECKKEVPRLLYVATDYDPYMTVLRQANLAVLLSSRGRVTQMIFPPFVFTLRRVESRWLYPLNHVIRKWLLRSKVRMLIRDFDSARNERMEISSLCLFCPEALELADQSGEFLLGSHNLLEPYAGEEKFHCVRCMNILNPTYFSSDEFQKILSNISAMLQDGGLLIAGSNQDSGSIVSGGIYEKTDDGFEQIWQSSPNECVASAVSRYTRART